MFSRRLALARCAKVESALTGQEPCPFVCAGRCKARLRLSQLRFPNLLLAGGAFQLLRTALVLVVLALDVADATTLLQVSSGPSSSCSEGTDSARRLVLVLFDFFEAKTTGVAVLLISRAHHFAACAPPSIHHAASNREPAASFPSEWERKADAPLQDFSV